VIPVAALMLEGELVELLDLFQRPAWQQHAACRGAGTETFFPTIGATAAPARAICASCSVSADCAAYARQTGSVGVWGGTTDTDRRRAGRAA
jgi:WhiB family redox-sensing transcriptional regulator